MAPAPPTRAHEKGGKPDKEAADSGHQLRIFVSGGSAAVGKSTICLGLLGALLKSGQYGPSDLAYIKPATQAESKTLVASFCVHHGISCRPIGPIVYYRGFTRAFLNGTAGLTSDQLLQEASQATEAVAQGKKIVIIDGVGYPSVGSICGTDNAAVAKACGITSVLLVGKSGVGDAVDSHNLNASYFEARSVPVIGAVFNKLQTGGYYSLEKCRDAVRSYFDQFQSHQQAFGFLPQYPALEPGDDVDDDTFFSEILNNQVVDDFIALFSDHVDTQAIINAACKLTIGQDQPKEMGTGTEQNEIQSGPKLPPSPLRLGGSSTASTALTREQIEAAANADGGACAPAG